MFTALLLRAHGWDVHVSERVATPLSGRGAGIVTHKRLQSILAGLGLDPTVDFGIDVQQRAMLDLAGKVVATLECPQIMTSWDRLFRMLRTEWPDDRYSSGEELQTVTSTDTTVVAHFSNGAMREGELLVGADGLRSIVRATLVGELTPQYAGYTAWRGLVAEADMPPRSHADLFSKFSFCLPAGEQMLGYPVAGEDNDLRPGHRRYNFVWYRPAHEADGLPRLLTDATGHTHSLAIPPPLIDPAVVADMRQAADRVLAPQFAEIVRATKQPFLQPIYDLTTPEMARGRIALLGDSAFVVRPHVGAGVTKAAEDAQALVKALDAAPTVPEGLARYAADRMPVGRRIIDRARHLGAYLQAQRHTEEERAAADRHRTVGAVLAETALMDF
jgi:2-polyprenyl-6-methoxyphenol hydroxylase-like FAD-dependent oxidoreductase